MIFDDLLLRDWLDAYNSMVHEQAVYEVDCLWGLFFLFLGLGFVIGLIVAIKSWIDFGWNEDSLGLIFMSTAIGAFFGSLGTIFSEHETDVVDHIEYKVTVSEDVNFNEFMSKYEVIDKEGLIYIIKEREVE